MPEELPLLVSPEWLEARIDAPDVRVIDASWYLPEAGRDARAEFASAHIPGAVHLDLSTDLAEPDAPVRNTAASPAALARAFGAAGIGSHARVVVYDRLGGFSAGRVWWTLRYAGHARAALLDGGFGRWSAERRRVSERPREAAPALFEARPDPRWLARRDDVLRAVRGEPALIVDARSAARFRGEAPEHTRRRGHIPGSVNVPYTRNLVGDPPVLRPARELRELYERAGVRPDRPVLTTCGSGVTASLAAFALTLAGHTQVSVYDGSWAEWGDAADLPVAGPT